MRRRFCDDSVTIAVHTYWRLYLCLCYEEFFGCLVNFPLFYHLITLLGTLVRVETIPDAQSTLTLCCH
jgi:hypothetical protein